MHESRSGSTAHVNETMHKVCAGKFIVEGYSVDSSAQRATLDHNSAIFLMSTKSECKHSRQFKDFVEYIEDQEKDDSRAQATEFLVLHQTERQRQNRLLSKCHLIDK